MPIVHQTSLNAGELSPSLYARSDVAKFKAGLKVCLNFFVHAHGGVSTRAGTKYLSDAAYHAKKSRVLPFQYNTEQAYTLEFADKAIHVYKDGALAGSPQTVTGITNAFPCVVTEASHGYASEDRVLMTGGMTQIDGNTYRIGVINANSYTLDGVDATSYDVFAAPCTSTWKGITSTYLEADLFDIVYAQSADTMTLTHKNYQPRTLTRSSHTSWVIVNTTFATSVTTPTGLSATPTTSGSIALKYKVTALAADGEESIASAVATGSTTTLTETSPMALSWTAVTGASRYLVYKYKGGSYGYIGTADSNSFTDDNINADASDAPPEFNNPFFSNNPRAAGFHQQREIYGGLANDTQNIEPSRIGSPNNFNKAYPAKDDDSFSIKINAKEANEIRHFVSSEDLIAFTSGGPWVIEAVDGFVAANVQPKKQLGDGISSVPPIETSTSILYITTAENEIREFAYRRNNRYGTKDVSILARHLFDGYTIVDGAFASYPYSIVWYVRSDGVLLGLTYVEEQDVWAWHRHTTDGSYESVSVVQEGAESKVYVVVKRIIGGVTKRFVEEFQSRVFTTIENAFCVDSGITYSGAATTVITGLDHLEGKTVSILAGGNVITPQTVTGGQITLAVAETPVHVGLGFTCDIETLRPSTPEGGLIPVQKSVGDLFLQVENTRGISAGPDAASLISYVNPYDGDYDVPIGVVTDLIEIRPASGWEDTGTVFIRQSDPLPATILSIMTDLYVGSS